MAGCDALENQLLSIENSFVSPMTSGRSITFCSSRTLPGHEYSYKASKAFFWMLFIFFPALV